MSSDQNGPDRAAFVAALVSIAVKYDRARDVFIVTANTSRGAGDPLAPVTREVPGDVLPDRADYVRVWQAARARPRGVIVKRRA